MAKFGWKTRKFNGVVHYMYRWYSSKREADRMKEDLSRKGRCTSVHITQARKPAGYVIWTRPKV